MTRAVRNRLIARVAARRRGEQGLTLIELLLSLAILAILTGFLAGGLSMARRAFGTDRASEIGSETSAAIQTVAALVGSALPVRFDGAGPKDAIGFDGRGEAIAFVGLSEGRSLRGGPHKLCLRRSGGDLVADFVPLNRGALEGEPRTSRNPGRGAQRRARNPHWVFWRRRCQGQAGLARRLGSRRAAAGSGFDPDRIRGRAA